MTALPAHLLRAVPGRMVIIWDGSPIHCSHTVREFLAHGAAQLLQVESLPAYAPALNPDKGLWQRLKGVEMRNLCRLHLPHLRLELRAAVNRVRHQPYLIKSCLRGAKALDFYVRGSSNIVQAKDGLLMVMLLHNNWVSARHPHTVHAHAWTSLVAVS